MAVKELIKKEHKEAKHSKPRVSPAVDIIETQSEYILYADLPGVDEKSLDVTLEKEFLSLRAEANIEVPEGYRKALEEFEPVVYERTFRIADDIDRDKIKASLRNGVLKLILPKADSAKPKKIEISG